MGASGNPAELARALEAVAPCTSVGATSSTPLPLRDMGEDDVTSGSAGPARVLGAGVLPGGAGGPAGGGRGPVLAAVPA